MELGVLFCDQVGSTALLTSLGDALADEVRRDLFEVLYRAAELCRGDVVKSSGDGLMVVFRSGASDALACGQLMLAMVDRLARRELWSQVQFKVGVSSGDAISDQGDWYGAAVNLAARLCAAAGPGELMAASEMLEAADVDASGWSAPELLTLKGFPDPVPVRSLPVDAEPTVGWPVPTELDTQGTLRFIGRQQELAELMAFWSAAAEPSRRRLTLAGPAGVGVSRLLAEFAGRVAGGGGLVLAAQDIAGADWIGQLVRGYTATATVAALRDAAGDDAAALAALCPLVGLRLGVVPAQVRPDAGELLRRLLARVSEVAPVLVVLDGITTEAGTWEELNARVTVVSGIRIDPGEQPAAPAVTLASLTAAEVATAVGTVIRSGFDALPALAALTMAETDGIARDVIAVCDELARELATADPDRQGLADAVRRAVPYKGLQVFDDADAVRFHGRERAVGDVLDALDAQPFVAVVGSSGSGKSSIVRAGCLPRLTAAGQRVVVLSPGEEPLRSLAAAWSTAAGISSEQLHESLEVAANLPAPNSGDWLLVVDQLEECFTLCTDEADRSRFLDLLTTPVEGVRILATLRGDYYGRASEHPGLAEALRTGTVLMAPATASELRTVIEAPAAGAHLRLEAGLADLILTDVTDRPAGLPLLSHALRETWRRRHGSTLSIAGYRQAGGATGAIARTADSVFDQFSPTQREIAKRLFLRLTALGEGVEDSRRRVPVTVLGANDPATSGVLSTLTAARLITADTDAEGRDVDELAHEALLREWPRLRGWLDEDRDELRALAHLENAARDWDTAGRPDTELYTGMRLEAAEELPQDRLNPHEQAYLEASLARRTAQRRTARRARRRLQTFTVVLVVLLVVAAITGLIAVGQRSSARKDARRAQQQTQVADARDLASQAQAQLSTQPAVALLLAAEAEKAQDSVQSRAELLATVYNSAHLARAATGFGDDDADFQSPNGVLLPRFSLSPDTRLASVIGTDGKSLRIYDFRTIKARTPNLDDGSVPIDDVSWSQNDRMAVAFNDGSLRVWDGTTGRQITSTTIPDAKALSGGAGLEFSPDGHVLVLRRISDGLILRWSIPDGRSIGRPLDLGGFSDLTFSPDGTKLAIADKNGIDVIGATGERPLQQSIKTTVGFQLSYGPGGKDLLVSDVSAAPLLVDASNGKKIRQFAFPLGYTGPDILSDGPRGAAYSPDGRYIASIDENGALVVWRTSDGSVVGGSAFTSVVRGDADSVLSFTPDSKQLVFGDAHEILTWNIAVTGLLPGGDLGSSLQNSPSAAVDRQHSRIIVLGADNRLRVWDSRSLRLLAISPALKLGSFVSPGLSGVSPVTGMVAIATLTTSTASGTTPLSGTVALYNPMLPAAPVRFAVAGAPVGASFSPDGRHLAVGLDVRPANGADAGVGYLDVFDVSHPQTPPHTIRLDALGANHVQWSADGSRILLSGNSLLVAVNATTMSVVAHQALPQSNHCCTGTVSAGDFVAGTPPFSDLYGSFNPDGLLTFLSAGAPGPVLPVIGTPGAGSGVTISPDGHLLAGSWSLANSTTQIWSLPSGKLLASTPAYAGTVSFVSNDRILVVSQNQAATLTLDPKALLTMACANAGRNLSRQEFNDFLGSAPYHRTCPQWPAGS